LVIETKKQPTNDLTEQVLFYANKFSSIRDQVVSVEMAINLIKKGLWKIPHGYKDITSQSIREIDNAQEALKQEQIAQDGKIKRLIDQAVRTNGTKSIHEHLKGLKNAIQGTMPEETLLDRTATGS
jgi:translation initiation factor 2B subunit (eIF-2B alpha/beta/delta family)